VAALNQVRAAGGVVWRRDSREGVEVLLVHRPKYDDWSLPKGKAEEGESDEDCALREVEEETGLCCLMGPELAPVDYHDRFDRPKHVRYWTMEPISGRFATSNEVDEARWVPVDKAAGMLTYPRDVGVLAGLASAVAS
jgi:8-oxo-dGTP pyrophosphatase MutT (NUDIX family)